MSVKHIIFAGMLFVLEACGRSANGEPPQDPANRSRPFVPDSELSQSVLGPRSVLEVRPMGFGFVDLLHLVWSRQCEGALAGSCNARELYTVETRVSDTGRCFVVLQLLDPSLVGDRVTSGKLARSICEYQCDGPAPAPTRLGQCTRDLIGKDYAH